VLPRHSGQTDMRKTIILAIATTFRGRLVVTGPPGLLTTPSATRFRAPGGSPLVTGSLTASVVPAT
jgi:hypothetical protein